MKVALDDATDEGGGEYGMKPPARAMVSEIGHRV